MKAHQRKRSKVEGPKWLQEAVHSVVASLRNAWTQPSDKKSIDVLHRLETDPRMTGVWKELGRRRSRLEFSNAIKEFLFHACQLAVVEPRAIKFSEAIEPYVRLYDIAHQLLSLANDLRIFSLNEEALELERVAELCGLEAEEHDVLDDNSRRPKRRGKHDDIRGFVIVLSKITRELFGADLFGVIAIGSNPAPDRDDISRSQVREILRSIRRARSKKRGLR